MARVNLRIDDGLKARADAEFRQMGLTFSAAITLLCTQVVIKHRLPFLVETMTADGGNWQALPLPKAVRDIQTPGKRLSTFIRENPISVPTDFKWSRAEAHERTTCVK